MAEKRAADPERSDEAFLEWLESLPDARSRYEQATTALERHQQAVQRLSGLRASAAAECYGEGESLQDVAQTLGVSRARVHQLVQEGRKQAAPGSSGRRQRRKGKKQ